MKTYINFIVKIFQVREVMDQLWVDSVWNVNFETFLVRNVLNLSLAIWGLNDMTTV